MSRVGKKAAISITAAICIAIALSVIAPFTIAQSAAAAAPVTTMTVTVASYNSTTGWYYGGVPTVSLTATDNSGTGIAATYYRINGTEYTYSAPFTVPDGPHTLGFYSKDNAGNTEALQTSVNSINFNVDSKAPNLTLKIYGVLNTTTGSYYGNSFFNLTATDSGSGILGTQYNFDNSVWLAYTGNTTVPDGTHTLYYRSWDAAGNINSTSTSVKVFNPIIQTSPSSNMAYDHNLSGILFMKPASDDVKYIQYSYYGDFTTTYTVDMDNQGHGFDLFNSGSHNYSIWYKAIGRSGDISPTHQIWFIIQTSQPTVSSSVEGSKDNSKGWYLSDVTVHFGSNIDSSARQFAYSWDNKSWTNVGDSLKVGKSTSKTLYYRVTDTFGNQAYGNTWLYFVPTTMNQGGMSNQVNVNGQTTGGQAGGQTGTATASPMPTEGPMPTPTQQPVPTPTMVPSPQPSNTPAPAAGSPLAIAVLVGVLVLLGIVAAAAYLFVFKPK